MEVRDGRIRRPRAASASDDEQRTARHGRLRRQPPSDSSDYQRGYLCGIVRGDGHIGTYCVHRAPTARERRDATASDSRSATSRRCERADALSRSRRASTTRAFDLLSQATVDQARMLARSARRRERASSDITRAHRVAALADRRLAQGLPRRDLRRRGLLRRPGAADLEHRPARSWTGRPRALRHFGFDHVEETAQAERASSASASAAAFANACASSTSPTRRSPASAPSRAWR